MARSIRSLTRSAVSGAEPFVLPLLLELRDYRFAKFKGDLFSAAMIAIVALPQAFAFALIVGLPPQAVLAGVIVGGFFSGLFNSSRHLIFGPTNTVSIVLAGTINALGASPLTPLEVTLLMGFLMGVFQLVAGLVRMGNLTQFISRSVIIGYGAGVGLLIIASQITNLLGLTAFRGANLFETLRHAVVNVAMGNLNAYAAIVGVTTLLMIGLIRRRLPGWPEGLIALLFFGALSAGFQLEELGVRTVRDLGEVRASLPEFVGPPLQPHLLDALPLIASAALAMAILGMLEGVSISKTVASRSGQRVNPNQDIVGMGVGNIMASMFGAMPGSASFVRTATNYQSGGRTQVAGLIGAVLVGVVVLLFAPITNFVPMATLAALLVAIAWRMINREQILVAVRATRSDASVFFVTLAATLLLNLDTAIYVGIGISLALFLKKASSPYLVEYTFNDSGNLAELEDPTRRQNQQISIIHVEGELFFGAADLFQDQVRRLAEDENIRVFILRMKNARHLDATSVLALQQLLDYLRRTGRHLLISGISPDVSRVLRNSGVIHQLGADNVFPAEANPTLATKRALLRASHLLQTRSADVRIFYDLEKANKSASSEAPVEVEKLADYQI
jgi:sulfate permease, SulP family